MAWEIPGLMVPFISANDQSSSGINESTLAGQYRCMRSSAAGYVRYQENTTGTIVGVLQNAPIAGEAASVMVNGVTKLWTASSAAAIAVGGTLRCTTSGRVDPITAATEILVGIALEAVSTGPALIAVLLSGPGISGSTSSLYV